MIEAAHLAPYSLPLKAPWQSARSRLNVRRGWLVTLTTGDGRIGYGDCAPLAAAGTETDETAALWLRRRLPQLRGTLQSRALATLELEAPPAARFAVETALLDLEAQSRGVPLWRLLSHGAAPTMACNATVGPLDAGIATRLAEAAGNGFRIAKVKIGLDRPEAEIRRLGEVCSKLPVDLKLRLDANAAWNEAEAAAFLTALDGLPVEMVEEPLATPRREALARLQALAPCPLALDEHLVSVGLGGAEPMPVQRVVLKPAACGGLGNAAAIARRLRPRGIGCVVTTTLEGPVGTWAALQLAFAGGSPELAHGVATGGWFDSDPALFPVVENGMISRPEEPGLGVRHHPKGVGFATPEGVY